MSSGGWGHMSGAAGVVDSLRRAGVTRVFGAPGVETTALFEAFLDSTIELVLVTHDRSAAFMADAHVRVTGELSACLLCPGPGLVNVLGGIGEARLDSSPMLVLVAGAGLAEASVPGSGTPILDHSILAQPLCKGVYSMEEPEEVPLVLSRAIMLARQGEPGPVMVKIPAQVQQREGRMEGTGFREGPRILSEQAEIQLDAAVDLIEQARVVGIYAGAGCTRAIDELAELADRLDAPVATTVTGLGVLPYIHPLCVGFGPGPTGTPLAEEAFDQCDLVIAIGCKFYDKAADGSDVAPKGNLIHIDVEPEVVGRNTQAQVSPNAPAKLGIRYLLDRLSQKENPHMRELVRQGKRRLRRAISMRQEWTDAVDPIKFFVHLRELLGSEDVVVLDSGRHAFFGIGAYPVQAPRTLLAPVDYGAMGFSVPAAVAAKLARPEVEVVACVGDGGFLLTGVELLTARRCNIDPVVVIFAEAPPLRAEEYQEKILGRETCVDLIPVNYEEIARALDVGYVRIMRDAELEAGLKSALTIEAPVVVEMRVAYRDAVSYLKAAHRADWQHKPRPLALRSGAGVILRRILASQ